MRRARLCQRSIGTYPFAGEDNAAPPHSSSLDISSNAPFTCSTPNLFCLLNFVDLSCEECSGEGFCWAGGAHRRGHVIKPVGLLHNGTFTSPSPPHQKNPMLLVLAFYTFYHSVGICWAGITFVSFCMNSNFEKANIN